MLNRLITWTCSSQTLSRKHHVYLYISSCTSAVIITKLLIVKLLYSHKKSNITFVIPIYTYFSHIRKSHHTLVNIKSPNYEIKGMNYNIKSMYILIMRYVNMIYFMTWSWKVTTFLCHDFFMLIIFTFCFIICQFWLNYYLYANL